MIGVTKSGGQFMLGLICQGVKLKCQVKFDWSDFFSGGYFLPKGKIPAG